MKKHFVGFVIFVLALVFGYVLVVPPFAIWSTDPSPLLAPDYSTTAVPTISVNVPAAPLAEEPEFKDLPELDEQTYPEPNLKLVDIFQTDAVYRESEVVAKSGETWITLFEQGDDYVLKSTKATVRKMKTISYPGDEFDVRLSLDKPGLPIFSVRNIPSIKPGKVNSLYLRPSWKEIDRRGLRLGTMGSGFNREFYLNKSEYVLRQSTGMTKSGVAVCVLVLESEGKSQVIAENYGDEIGDLLWAGDIDNDGKLDLYFDEANEKGYFGVGLYLSSEAEPGELVKLAAVFGMGGC